MTAGTETMREGAEPLPLTPKKEGRNIGVELFRVIAMLMVVYLHMTGQGGVLAAANPLSPNYKIALTLQVLTFGAVNCYALISGYANVKTNFKFRRIVYLWVQTAFLITMVNFVMHFFVPGQTVSFKQWISGLMPLAHGELWYFCAYFLMVPLLPLLNKGLLSLKKWQHIMIIVMMQMPTIFRLISHKDSYVLSNGYSAMWLICVYIIGAYFRIYGAPKWAKPFVTLPTFFAAATVAYFSKLLPEIYLSQGRIEDTADWYVYRSSLVAYVSPCVVIMSIMLLLFFMQLDIKNSVACRLISLLGKATWGVYAIHVCTTMWRYTAFWNKFRAIATYGPVKMLFMFLAVGLAMYLVLLILSISQAYLFKLMRVNRGIDWISDRLADWVEGKKKPIDLPAESEA